jgi:CDP-diacylglycerol--glycerol-3-phosphate 3-phosphatidyltransferase
VRAPPPISPNAITAARLPLAPLAVLCLVSGSPWGTLAAAALALLLEVTDILDGRIARSYGHVTTFGKLFDPFSDAFSRFTLFLGLYHVGVAVLWMIIAIFYRDSSVSFLRTVSAVRNVVLSARQSGKIKAVVQGVGTQICFLSLAISNLWPDAPIPADLPWWSMLAMTLVTMLSFVDYFVGNLPILRSAWSETPTAE